MPTNIKIGVSILTISVALIMFYVERQENNGLIQWFVLGLGLFMAFSLWLFPEPRKTKSSK